MTRFYLAYGANLNRAEMAFRCPQAVPVESVELEGWQLEFCSHATVQQHAHGRLQAGVWAISDACESNLDRFEGWPVYYRKQVITVRDEPTMMYIMNHPLPQTPTAGYLKCLAQGYEDWGLDLDLLWQAYERAEQQEYAMYDDDPQAHAADFLDTAPDDAKYSYYGA
jgi:gamma-glutamylcyclotransferase (GGCT)/AIG2-like uncharacterized protein YtfP